MKQSTASESSLGTGHTTVADLARDQGLELLRFAYLLCGDRQHAEDLLQDVLLSMHRRFPDDLAVNSPVGYARRCLANANVNRARRRSSSEVVVDLVPDSAVEPPDHLGERDALWRAVRRLPTKQRTVLVMRFYADSPDSDIAAALGCRLGTVRSIASRALTALRGDPTLTFGDQEGRAS